jgi:hypothetical protein
MPRHVSLIVLFSAMTLAACEVGIADELLAPAPLQISISVEPSHVLRTMHHRMLAGSNIAVWISPKVYASPQIHDWLGDMGMAILRMPGGSFSDQFYWNGHGVRDAAGKIDPTKMGPDGYPAIDYSDYAPSIAVDPKTHRLSSTIWSGNVDAKALHEFIHTLPGNVQTLVCVNVGTGRAVDAAEWVRWANKKMGYNVRYWELGNELDGDWEAGHFLPGGGVLTGDMYAQRYKEFAHAMKAVDPTIKIGGAASSVDPDSFCEHMLRQAGDDVDFVSIHTYPGDWRFSDEEQFEKAKIPDKQVAQARQWIQKYQPKRASQIEIAYSEWNVLDPPSPLCSDLFSALWSSEFLGHLASNGVDFATQWDAFTHDAQSGHSLFLSEPDFARKSQFHAFWLWNHYAGDQLVQSSQVGPSSFYSMATRSDDAVVLMLVNTDRQHDAAVGVKLNDFSPAKIGERALLSTREYFWNQIAHRIDWNSGPDIQPLEVDPSFTVNVPAFSLMYVKIPQHEQISNLAQQGAQRSKIEPAKAQLRLVLPEQTYAGDSIDGWIEAIDSSTQQPYLRPLSPVILKFHGAGGSQQTEVRLDQPAAHFVAQPTAAGTFFVDATLNDATSATASVRVKPSVPQPRVFWNFTEPTLSEGYESDWKISADNTVKPGKQVARVDIPNVTPDDKSSLLLRLTKFPGDDKLNRANIRGIIFQMMLSKNFSCDDPNANIQVIIQSPANWWMWMGQVPLSQMQSWKSVRFDTDDPKFTRAMPQAQKVWFVLHASKPVRGSIYIDNVGFMVR